MTRPIIALDALCRNYLLGDTTLHALDRVHLELVPQEMVAIMGASGSGKSTLMNIMGCLDRPSSGTYFLDGTEVSTLGTDALAEVRNRALGFVFQSFNLLSRTSALENVELPLLYSGVATAERRQRCTAALQRVGLGERMDHFPSQLSGGQQQRVAIARALINRPKVILADEPTGNLDSRTSLEVMDLFQEMQGSGITVVLVTHEPDIAAFAQRVVLMKDGRVVSDTRRRAAVARAALQSSAGAVAQ
jgi:putative ABC transport system ATP-binding protein